MRNLHKGLTNKKIDKIVTEVLQDEVKSKNLYNKISKNMIEGKAFEKINNLIPLFDSVVGGKMYKTLSELSGEEMTIENEKLKLAVDWPGIARYISEFNDENKYNSMYKNMKFKIKNVYLVKYQNIETLLFVYEFQDSERIVRYNCLTDYKAWFVVKDTWNGSEYPYTSWIDTLILKSKDKFIREVEPYKIFIDNKSGKIIYLERYYQFPEIKLPYSDKKYNNKIGTLDLETFISSNETAKMNIEDSKDSLKDDICGKSYNVDARMKE
jgi:hypothetical protein